MSGVSMAKFKIYRNLSVILFSVLIAASTIATFLAVKSCVEVQIVNQDLQGLKWEVNEMRVYFTQMQLGLGEMSYQETESPATTTNPPVLPQPIEFNQTNDSIDDSQNYNGFDHFNSDAAYEGDIDEDDGYDNDSEDSSEENYEREMYEDYLEASDQKEDSELRDVVTVIPGVSSNDANDGQRVSPTFQVIFDPRSNTFESVDDDYSPPEGSDSPSVENNPDPMFALPQQDTSTGDGDIGAQYQNGGEYDPKAVENELIMRDGPTNDWKPSAGRVKRNVINHRGNSTNLGHSSNEETAMDSKEASTLNFDRETTATEDGGVQSRLSPKQKEVKTPDEKLPRLGGSPKRTFVDWLQKHQ